MSPAPGALLPNHVDRNGDRLVRQALAVGAGLVAELRFVEMVAGCRHNVRLDREFARINAYLRFRICRQSNVSARRISGLIQSNARTLGDRKVGRNQVVLARRVRVDVQRPGAMRKCSFT